MATKQQRHALIMQAVREHSITSQEELRERLAHAGVEVTQATLSRDLQEIGVLKGAGGYVLPQNASTAGADPARLERALRRELRSIELGGNIIVIRTDPGHANALAAEFDRARLPGVIGTIAGDDTMLLVVREAGDAKKLKQRLRSMASAD